MIKKKLMDTVDLFKKMVKFMKDNGKTISKRVRDVRDGVMGHHLRVTSQLAKKMETEDLFFKMVPIIKDNLKTIIYRDRGKYIINPS